MNAQSVQAKTGARILRIWLWVCGGVAAVLFFAQLWEIPARSALRGYDNTFNYLWLRSAAVGGDWDFRNDLEQCDTLVPEQRTSALALPPTKASRLPNKYGIGWALITVPFYLVADGIVALGREMGLTALSRDGYNPVYQVCIQTGHAALALFGLFLVSRTLARMLGNRGAALAGVALVWAASPLVYYQTANVSMSHGAAFFCVAVYAYALERARQQPTNRGPWLVAGAALGLAVITRFQLAIFFLPGAWTLCMYAKPIRQLLTSSLWMAVGTAPFIALQLYAWRVVYGEWLVFSYGSEGESFHWGNPEFIKSLFSSWHGLFYWHPFLLVATLGMLVWVWKVRGVAGAWLISFLLTLYVSAAWWCWWFASSFGNRAFDAALWPLMAGTAWVLAQGTPRVRTVVWTLGVAAGVWNFYVVLLYRSGAISRHAPVSWGEMVEAAARLRDAVQF